MSLNLRLRFTRIITDCVTDDFDTSFLSERENRDSSVDIRVKSVSMILSSVLQAEIKFHTDYHGWVTDDFVTSFFV